MAFRVTYKHYNRSIMLFALPLSNKTCALAAIGKAVSIDQMVLLILGKHFIVVVIRFIIPWK